MREPAGPPRSTVTTLLRDGVLDAELAALVWLLLEARLPLIVTGRAAGVERRALLEAFLMMLPPGTRRVEVRAGGEEALRPLETAAGAGMFLVAGDLRPGPGGLTGPAVRTLVRAIQLGHGLGASAEGESLGDLLGRLQGPSVGLTLDELRGLGLVLVFEGKANRVIAAHYLRPLERDGQGHLQRRPPAVLATWDLETDTFEHFAWGITPELAPRVGRTQADFEEEQAARAALLHEMAALAVVEPDALARALAAYRTVRPAASTMPA